MGQCKSKDRDIELCQYSFETRLLLFVWRLRAETLKRTRDNASLGAKTLREICWKKAKRKHGQSESKERDFKDREKKQGFKERL
jgi:hypothetical protein